MPCVYDPVKVGFITEGRETERGGDRVRREQTRKQQRRTRIWNDVTSGQRALLEYMKTL
jgi:hypothetical protein